ncbi:MAG TPA: hypothetical protein VG273_16590 [Bryobacteraceae bacterium]|nr:hypothetical protein [Bryobacteraceae bacterium]
MAALTLGFAFICAGQTSSGSSSADRTLTDQISDLQKKVAALTRSLNDLRKSVWVLESQLPKSVEFDPASPGPYLRIDGGSAPLLISLGTVEPYLDGYKFTVLIGNPTTATFNGFELTAKWAPRLGAEPDADALMKWFDSQRSKTFSRTEALPPGRWTAVDLIVPTTKPQQFGWLELSIALDQISFSSPTH